MRNYWHGKKIMQMVMRFYLKEPDALESQLLLSILQEASIGRTF